MVRFTPTKNTIPAHPQDAESSDGDDQSISLSSSPSQTPSKHPNSARNGGHPAATSLDLKGTVVRSAFHHTIGSGAASSLDIYDDNDDDNNSRSSSSKVNDLRRRQLSNANGGINHQSSFRRRRTLEMAGNSANTLMVSFSRLNEQELTHLRKWNRRLQRTEVFDKYYFPAKWEAKEMEALIGFLKLEDPTLKTGGGGLRGGSLRSSGSIIKKNTNGNGAQRRINRKFQPIGSWQSGDKLGGGYGNGGLSSSLTSSLKDSAGILSKLLADPKPKQIVDPVKLTKQALDSIFFPYVHDPKSVLLKRSSVFLHNTPSLHNERELMIFTHGFLLSNVVLEDAFSLFLALSDREFLTEKSLLDYLQAKFTEMDDEESGEIEKWELQRLFTQMGIPMGEAILDELIQRTTNTSSASVKTQNDQDDKVNWQALHKSLQGVFLQTNNNEAPLPNTKSLGLDDSGRGGGDAESVGAGTGLKKFLGSFQRRKTTKVEYACMFSHVVRVDSLDICHGDNPVSNEIAESDYAITTFSVTLSGQENDPLIFVCPGPEHRDSWVEAFRPGVVHALTKSSRPGMPGLRKKLGWQHLVIRSSFMSLVILNDAEALKSKLQVSGVKLVARKLRMELNLLDEYNGYSPLHYATILGHTECMVLLLEAGSKVTLEDREKLSPMYHALSLRSDDVANVLDKFGADRNDDLRKLIAHEIQAEELKNPPSRQASGGLETHIENSSSLLAFDMSSADEGEEEDIDTLDVLLMQAANKFGGM